MRCRRITLWKPISTSRFIGLSVSVPVRPPAERKRGDLPASRTFWLSQINQMPLG